MAGRTEVEPAPLPPAPRPPMRVGTGSLTLQASARRLDPKAVKGETALGGETSAQLEAWRNYELPEVQKLITSASGLLGQCRLYVGYEDDQGKERPLRDEKGQPAAGFDEAFVADAEATLARFVDRNGSQAGLLTTTAELWDVTGESYMTGWPVDDDGNPAESADGAAGERWEVLSRSAIDKASGRWVVQLEPGQMMKLPEEAVAYRMWRSHPRFPGTTRSWLMSAQEPCRDLRVFAAAQRAAGRSGSVADLILVPSEASPRIAPKLPPQPPGSPKPIGIKDAAGDKIMGDAAAIATFIERVIGDAVLEVSQDAQAGRTVINPVVSMAAQYIEKVAKVSLGRTVDQGLKDLVQQARERIADSADAESEFLFGLGDTNRWNGAQIADTDYRRSFKPKAEAIADSWTMELLWGGMRGLNYQPEQYKRVRVYVDPKGVVAEPDLGKAATIGLQLGAIGYPTWREANGFSEDAAPTPEEQAMLLEAFGRTKQSGSTSAGGSEAPTDQHGVNPAAGAAWRTPELAVPRPELAGQPDEPIPTTGRPAGRTPTLAKLKGRAVQRERNIMDELLVVEQVARARLEEAAELALDAALTKAGSKLRNWSRQTFRATGQTDLLARVTAADTRDVAAVLGPEQAAKLAEGQYATPEARRDDLFGAALVALLLSFGRITDEAYHRAAIILGVTWADAELAHNRAHGEAVLTGSMLMWADRTVFDPVKGITVGEQTGLRVPSPVLRRAQAAAGGAPVEAGIEPTVEAAGGTVFGPTVMQAAEAAAQAEGTTLDRLGFRWVYGDEPRMAPWEPHQELDGAVLSGPDDPQLEGAAPDGTSAFPGDHFGCRCDWVPELGAGD